MQTTKSIVSFFSSRPSHPGQRTSSDQSYTSEDVVRNGNQKKFGEVRMMMEKQFPEIGSDSDSGRGTVSSDIPESPISESPLSFPNGHHCDSPSSGFKPLGYPDGHRAAIRGQEALYKNGFGNETMEDADAGCPVSPIHEIDYDYCFENPVEISCSPDGSLPGVSGFAYPVEKAHHHFRSTETEIASKGRRHGGSVSAGGRDPQLFFTIPNISGGSDRNDLTVRLIQSLRCEMTDKTGRRHQSHETDRDDGCCDSEETPKSGYNEDIEFKVMRQQLQAKCEHLFGARSASFGGREVRYRLGGTQEIHRSYAEGPEKVMTGCDSGCFRDASTIDRDSCTSGSILGQNSAHDVRRDDAAGESCPHGSRDQLRKRSPETVRDMSGGFHDDHQSDVTCVLRPPVATHPAIKRCDTPSNGYHSGRRLEETSFISTMDRDSRLPGDERTRSVGSLGTMNSAEYNRTRSVSYEYASSGTWKGDLQNPFRVPGLPPFSEEAPATLPRPNKPGAQGDLTVASGQMTGNSSVKDRHIRSTRRWTNVDHKDMDELSEANHVSLSTKSTRTGPWSKISSILKPKTHPPTASLASQVRPEDGFKPEVVEAGRVRSTGRRSPSPSAVEMVNLGESRSASVPSTPTKNDQYLRGRTPTSPNQDGGTGSNEVSLVQRIRTRFAQTARRKYSSPITGTIITAQHQVTAAQHRHCEGDDAKHVTRNLDHPTTGCDGTSGDVIPVAKATGMLSRFHSLQESIDDKESTGHMEIFSTLQLLKSGAENQNELWNREPNIANAAIRRSTISTPFVKAESSSEFATGCDASENCYRTTTAPPSEVTGILCEIDELVATVDSYAASNQETEIKTILEEDFNEYKQDMIDALKNFIENCKIMVIKTPASASGFLEELVTCRRLLGDVIDRYRPLVDCNSLPADRSRFAGSVAAVATSFRETAVAATDAAGRTAKHPTVRRLRSRANQLAADLTDLMKTTREMSYNRLSRRF